MAANPAFAATPHDSNAQIATANALRDGTGTLGSVFTAGANGSKIEEVRIAATGTTTAGNVKLFVFDGTNNRYLTEVSVPAITPSATVLPFLATLTFDNLILQATHVLKAAPNNAETFNVFAFGGDF